MIKFPCKWGGKTIRGVEDLVKYTGYTKYVVAEKVGLGLSVEEIMKGSFVGRMDIYYPQVLNGKVIMSDKDAAEVIGVSKRRIEDYRSKGISLEGIVFVKEKNLKASADYKIDLFAKENGIENGEVFLEKYNKFGFSKRTIVYWIKKDRGFDFVVRKMSVLQYPYQYYGVVYNSDKEVSEKWNLLESTVHNRRLKGYSFKDIIQPVKEYADGYPFKTDDGRIIRTDKEMAELCGKDINWVRNKRRFGCTPYEMYMGSVGIPVIKNTSQGSYNSGKVLLLGVLGYKNIKDCLERLGLMEFYSLVCSVEDREEGVGRAFVKFAEKYNKGYVTPDLKIDHYTHEYNGTLYFCCYLCGEVEYWNTKQILNHRMRYIKIDTKLHIYRNNGVFNQINYAETFYCISNNSIKRKSNEEGISLEKATYDLAFNKRGKRLLTEDGTNYFTPTALSKKLGVNNQTLISRLKVGMSIEEACNAPVIGSLRYVTVDNYIDGRKVGKREVSYCKFPDLELKLGFSKGSIVNIRHSKGFSLEETCNYLLECRYEFWTPYVKDVFKSMPDITRKLGLGTSQMRVAYAKGRSEGRSFWESLIKYYMGTEKSFKLHKDEFKIVHRNGSVSFITDFVSLEDKPYYHYKTIPDNTIRLLPFDALFAILIENKLGR